MAAVQIQVISPRTWGQFGNYLAATRLTRVLADGLPARVELLEAEQILPWIGEIGARIRDVTLNSPDAAALTVRYDAIVRELDLRFPQGFEVEAGAGHRAELHGLVMHLRRTRPRLVIATKGFLARLCLAAARAVDADQPRAAVASFVTNPGLLQLSVHRSKYLDLTIVSMEWAKRLLMTTERTPEQRIRVVGPLVAEHELGEVLADAGGTTSDDGTGWGGDAADDRPRIIIFSNRGGEAYATIVRHLARRHPDIDLVFVGYNDPDLVADVSKAGVDGWRFRTGLSQAAYFSYLHQTGQAPHGLLISKAGPNTTLEAAFKQIPVLMLESGLPMERWVGRLIAEENLGRCCTTVDELLSVLDTWLANPSHIRAHKQAVAAFARQALDQSAAKARVVAAVRELVTTPATVPARSPTP